jgi:predicted MFS family arabinose efflux permease
MTQTPVPAAGVPVRPGRWLVLACFALLVACTQVLWLSVAPITTQAAQALGVSEGAIGDLAVINPIMYVLLAIPTGRWMDRRFASALAAGAAFTAAGAVLRAAGSSSYPWILVGQVVMSVGQPLVLNASTKVAARYFPPTERTAAISVASAAQFVGILAAAISREPLLGAGGLRLVLAADAAVTVVAALAVLVTTRVPPSFATESATPTSLGWLRHDRLLWKLAGLLFVGVGIFNAVATWLDPILGDLGHPGTGGLLIAVMTVTGIAGAAVLPSAAARRDRRRALLVTTTVSSVLVFLAVAVVPGIGFVGFALAVEGFLLLACLPVALDWSELESGPTRASTATGFLLLAGNLGGAVLVLVVQAFIATPRLALATIAALAVPGVMIATRLPGHARSHLDDDRPPEPEPAA